MWWLGMDALTQVNVQLRLRNSQSTNLSSSTTTIWLHRNCGMKSMLIEIDAITIKKHSARNYIEEQQKKCMENRVSISIHIMFMENVMWDQQWNLMVKWLLLQKWILQVRDKEVQYQNVQKHKDYFIYSLIQL